MLFSNYNMLWIAINSLKNVYRSLLVQISLNKDVLQQTSLTKEQASSGVSLPCFWQLGDVLMTG